MVATFREGGLLAGAEALGQGLIRAVWTDDEALSTKINPRVAHYTGQAELAEAIQEGLEAEPGRPDLAAVQEKVKKDVQEADEDAEAADRMRRLSDGTPHALTALANGLKVCLDHPILRGYGLILEGRSRLLHHLGDQLGTRASHQG